MIDGDMNCSDTDMKIFCVSADFRFFPDPRIFPRFFKYF